MRTLADWWDAPGPGDLDLGPHACLGGACPHDHGDDDEPADGGV